MAANNLLKQSLLNGFRMVPITPFENGTGFAYTLPFRLGIASMLYHTAHFDSDWHKNSLQDWQMKIDYPQKWQLEDQPANQFSVPEDTTLNAAIYDCHGVKLLDITPQIVTNFPGNLIYDYATATYQYKFSFEGLGLNTGRYYFVLSIEADEVVYLYISEPQEVKSNHLGTVLIKFNHTDNRKDGFFFSLLPDACLRVEATVAIETWNYSDTSFEGQGGETEITNSVNKRRFKFVVGDKSIHRPMKIGVAEWMVDKVVNVLGCDQISIDGKQFVRNPNVDPEIETFQTMPLITATFKLFEQNISDLRIFGYAETRIVFPDTYPFAVVGLAVSGVPLGDDIVIIEDITGVEAILAYAATLGLPGTFRLEGSTLIYKHIKGERRKPFTGTFLMKQFRFTIKKNTTAIWTGASYQGGTIAIDYGQTGIAGNLQAYYSIGDVVDFGKSYSGGGATEDIAIWHNDDIINLTFTDSATNYYLYSLDDTSSFPINCETLYISDQYEFPELHADLFADYVTNNMKLKYLTVTGSLLTLPPLFHQVIGIQYYDFTRNAVASADFEDFTNNLVAQYNVNNGTLLMTDQDPIAPATSTTLANIAALAADGWVCTTD